MKTALSFLMAILVSTTVYSQGALQFENGKSKSVIPFQLINNLIFIPINVNGVTLNFLLDSGIEETVLFSLDDTDEISFQNVQTIKLRGLGSQDHIECLKSTGNRLQLPHLSAKNHDIYIILDQEFNFSSHIGIPVNGIIGYHFFRDNLIEINYDKRKIFVHKDSKKIRKKIESQYEALPMTIESNKPYVVATIGQQEQQIAAKLLIDTGSSDAIWLFDNKSDEISVPDKSFDDFLGRGFSGEIYGKRARVSNFGIDDFSFSEPIAAFPDSTSITHIKMVENRVGSVGGEILRRFSVVFDYKNNVLFLKKGNRYGDLFQYNMSGIELQHDGLQWVPETVQLNAAQIVSTYDVDGTKSRSYKYKFELKPVYCISSVRKDSPAELAGLQKGDIIISINQTKAFRYTLQEIAMLLKSEPGRTIEVEVERTNPLMKYKNQLLKFSFQLQSML